VDLRHKQAEEPDGKFEPVRALQHHNDIATVGQLFARGAGGVRCACEQLRIRQAAI
jgi:hypothetical protein